MKRRFFALLAVPAHAPSFALASPATDQAHAYISPSPDTVCAIARSLEARAPQLPPLGNAPVEHQARRVGALAGA